MASEAFLCLLCKNLPLKAHSTPCNHFFCGSCLEDHIKKSIEKIVCPTCGKVFKKAKKVPQYEEMLRKAFPTEYTARDVTTPLKKIDMKDEIGALNKAVQDITTARNLLFSRIRSNDIGKQAEEFFGTSRKYSIIVADVPWNYPNQHFNGGIKTKYSQMSDEQIYSLPVEGLCRDNACLLFWTTFPKLQVALHCMYSWNFRYTTCFLAWSKLYPKNKEIFTGAGCYSRPNTEVCLLGLKGEFSKLRMRNTCVSNAQIEVPKLNPMMEEGIETIEQPNDRLLELFEGDDTYFWEAINLASPLITLRGEHSEKPEESYDKICTVFGDLPRFDMFARKRRSGWDSFGNQLDMFKPDKPLDPEFEKLWKLRQDRNAEYQEKFIPNLTQKWEERETVVMDFTPQ